MRRPDLPGILLEALAVAAVGAGVAFAANALSPRGLKLQRDYFPTRVASSPVVVTNAPPILPSPNSTNNPVAERLKTKGLTDVNRADVKQLLANPQVVFVDARNPEKFEAGHLPGAVELDAYHPERSLDSVLPRCQAASKVVVYCAGGECEDADTVAILLRDAGIPADHLVVYGGGMDEWSTQHESIEQGAPK